MDSIRGAIVALTSSILVALLFAYTFRIPIPMGGMLGPLGGLNPYSMGFSGVLTSVAVAWLFYGLFGGFVILPVFGAIAGHLASQKFSAAGNKRQMVVLWAVLAGMIPVFGLSILDLIIGPW
ncbi:MAG: hypothetical protein HKM00_10125 [Gallionella sp.]|jgi:hypothetical protein|nr:hypothetical protein [Gallionella sp.]